MLGVEADPVDVTVTLSVSAANDISATVTHGSVAHLRLAPARPVVALVKAPCVSLAPPAKSPNSPGCNRVTGQVTRRVDGANNSEVQLDIGDGKILTAVVPRERAEKLEIATGRRLDALFKASHVILAAD